VKQHTPSGVTLLLQGWQDGDQKALKALLPLVYKELRRLARFQLQQERRRRA
jgi:ECF sigma factor